MSDAAANETLQSIVPVFLVDDIAATMLWYRRNLGFDGEAVPPSPPHNFAILSKDDVVIFLQQLSGYRRPDVYHEREGGVWSAYVRTRRVHALFETLRGLADVAIVQPLHHQPYGETEFEIRDPNGYVLVFAERL
jgi:uncharacterized glyoxalase superfamily protein PhnB